VSQSSQLLFLRVNAFFYNWESFMVWYKFEIDTEDQGCSFHNRQIKIVKIFIPFRLTWLQSAKDCQCFCLYPLDPLFYRHYWHERASKEDFSLLSSFALFSRILNNIPRLAVKSSCFLSNVANSYYKKCKTFWHSCIQKSKIFLSTIKEHTGRWEVNFKSRPLYSWEENPVSID
jgi:hypothetical protein